MKYLSFILLIICLFIYSCSGDNNEKATEDYKQYSVDSLNNCNQLPSSFSSYNEAINLVTNASFSFVDNVNTSKSTVIEGAKYYSCDNRSGFLIIGVNNHRYIYQGVPINVWNNFKTASSFGSFYNTYIKNSYQLRLN